jgi:hypothetical protein
MSKSKYQMVDALRAVIDGVLDIGFRALVQSRVHSMHHKWQSIWQQNHDYQCR